MSQHVPVAVVTGGGRGIGRGIAREGERGVPRGTPDDSALACHLEQDMNLPDMAVVVTSGHEEANSGNTGTINDKGPRQEYARQDSNLRPTV